MALGQSDRESGQAVLGVKNLDDRKLYATYGEDAMLSIQAAYFYLKNPLDTPPFPLTLLTLETSNPSYCRRTVRLRQQHPRQQSRGTIVIQWLAGN